MGGYVRPENMTVFSAAMLTLYLVFWAGALYAIFGFLRTLATRLPRPEESPPELMPLDIPPKLYYFCSSSRKAWKLVTFGALALLFVTGWLFILSETYAGGSQWFGWGLVRVVEEGEKMVFVAHALVFWVFAVFLGQRAVQHANKLPQPVQTK